MYIEISSDGSSSLINGLRKEREKGKSLLSILNNYTAIDIETTGLDSKFDEIIEIGAIRYIDGQEVTHFASLVKPENEIPNFITKLTGISNEMVKNSPDIASILPEFINFIDSDTLLGHNVNFDINFLYDECIRCFDHKLRNDFIDTMRLSRHLFKDFENHKLRTLIKNFELKEKAEHRSLSDCRATAKCYEYMNTYISENSIDLKALVSKYHLKASDIKAETTKFNQHHPLYNKVCVFTGTLEKMVRKNAMQIVANFGGVNADSITTKTNFLILGNNDYCSSIKDGKSNKQKKAEQLILKGQDIQIISENVFYDLIDTD